MCIAIYKEKDVNLYDSTLENCWYANSDGAGFMVADKGKLLVVKGLMSLDAFMEAYEPHRMKKAVIHFRIRTHGEINHDNCHPYQVDNNLAFVHNGTINDVDTVDKSMSDTWHFNEQFIKPIRDVDKSFFMKPHYQRMIDKYIGFSKLIFLNSKGEHAIINERAGNWDSGCWFSNTSWKPREHVTYSNWKRPTPKEVDTGSIIDYTTKSSDKPLESGNVCWIKYDGSGLKYADYVVVKYVYNDNTIGVYKKDDPESEYRLHVSQLERTSIRGFEKPVIESEVYGLGDFAMFTSNFNHFRAFDDVIIMSNINDKTVLVQDPYSGKDYHVPKNLLTKDYSRLGDTCVY